MDSNTQPQPDSNLEPGASEAEAPDKSAPGETVDTPSASDEPGTPTDQPDDQMPDASSLVAMAAMHMETPALLHVLISVFHAHAWRSMGLVADHSGEVRKDMASAQTAIDCFAFLLGKIEGSLEEGEKRDVQRRLMDLRMNYVAKMREG